MHRCLGDNCKRVYRQTVTMEMKTTTIQGGDSYPSRLADINGGRFRSQKPEKTNEKTVQKYIREIRSV
jgi:hypothetical protein